jgi:prepilin-type processing-associated H-X9-DG protein
MMYAQDSDEMISPAQTGACPGPDAYGWGDLIFPYVKNVNVFTCPSNTFRAAMNTTITPQRLYRDRGGSTNATWDCVANAVPPDSANYSYGVNATGPTSGANAGNTSMAGPWFEYPVGARIFPNSALASITAPASTAGIGEGRGASPWWLYAGGNTGPAVSSTIDSQVDGRRHPGNQAGDKTNGCNMMFMDGHAKYINLFQSVSPNIWTVSDQD